MNLNPNYTLNQTRMQEDKATTDYFPHAFVPDPLFEDAGAAEEFVGPNAGEARGGRGGRGAGGGGGGGRTAPQTFPETRQRRVGVSSSPVTTFPPMSRCVV